jgi:hypothetical protein
VNNKADQMSVLLQVRDEKSLEIDERLITACLDIQNEHQYDKERNTLEKMRVVIENYISSEQGDKNHEA